MRRRVLWAAVAAVVVLMTIAVNVAAQCRGPIENSAIYCGYDCSSGTGFWGCWEEDSGACCVWLPEFNTCGGMDINDCPECAPGGCGF